VRRALATWQLVAGVAIVAAVALVALSVVDRGLGPIVALPGALLVLWLPGRAMSTLLVPRGLTTAERLAVDLAASFSLTIATGLVLGIAGVPLGRPAWAISLAAVTVAFAILSAVRPAVAPLARRVGDGRLPGAGAGAGQAIAGAPATGAPIDDASAPRTSIRTTPFDLALIGLAAVLVVAAFGVARLGASAQPRDHFTEVWLVPASADNVTVGVRNDEAGPTSYRLVLSAPGVKDTEWPSISLAPGEQWEKRVALPAARQPGAALTVYRSDAPDEVYRQVKLGPAASGP
jgi:uncharacterized membrane protein